MTRWIAGLTAMGLLGVASCGLFSGPPPAPTSPNLLVIVWDTVRADRLSLYGYDKPTTPKLDAWAKDAVVFERAVSPAIWTPPSHSSMFTGMAPSHHGVKATYKWLDAHHTTLAEWLGSHGYDTWLFSANPYVAPVSNITQGFGSVNTSAKGTWKAASKAATKAKLLPNDASTDISPKWKPFKGQPSGGANNAFKDAAPVSKEALLTWLSDEHDASKPWFGFINMMEAHIPRIPSAANRKKLMTPAQRELALKTDVSQINLLSYIFGKKSYTPDELAAINGVYDASLRDLDDETAALMTQLGAGGHLDNTIVVLTSDHGENLGDHAMFGHKFSVYETLAHVPLVIWYPKSLSGRRVDHPVSNLNLFSTLIDLVGLDRPDTHPDGARNILTQAGSSPAFIELIEATPVAVNRIDDLYGLDDKERWLRTFKAVVDDEHKLVQASDGSEQLYHLATDPGEQTDISEQEPALVERLGATLREWSASIPPYDASKRTKADKKPKQSKADIEMLRTLGYVEDDK